MSRHSTYGKSDGIFLFWRCIMPDYKNSDMTRTIEEYVRNPRYRAMLRLRFCEGATYEEIAETVNYSTQHVKRVCKTYKPVLMSHL